MSENQEMTDDERLAAEWAASLEAEEEGSDGASEAEADSGEGESSDAALADEWAAALAADEQHAVNASRQLITDVSKPDYNDFTEISKASVQDGPKRELDFILDIPLDISAELGRTRLLIKDLLQLGQGSVVELNKLAGEPLEVFVNGKLVARGEAVVVNEKFGVRLTDIISPIERITQIS